jgi:primosomal protein N' (replication factor Y)
MTGAPAVARVCVDSPLPHLDRLFDYAIPAPLAPVVAAGSRVRVRFAGRLVHGVVCALGATSDFDGALTPIRTSASIPSYTAEGLALARAVADRYGGNLWDVLRLMAPPRVASVEKREARAGDPRGDPALARASGALHAGGPDSAVSASIATGGRLVWEALPWRGSEASTALGLNAALGPIPAHTILATVIDGCAHGSSIIIVPDARAIDAFVAVAGDVGLSRWTARSGGQIAVIHSDDSAAQRYGAYVAAMRGETRLVLGTRPAVFTPVPRLVALAIWDDGNSSYREQHAPYPNVLAVAAMRADREGAGLLIGGFSQSVAARALVEHGWADGAPAARGMVRDAIPAITVLGTGEREREGGSGWHWMPGRAWAAARTALGIGPVLLLVPRSGYVQGVACTSCRAWAACRDCGGPLALAARGAEPTCIECGLTHRDWHCHECGDARLAHVRQGIERIAEQLRSMEPGAEVTVSSSGTGIVADGEVTGGFVVATPGAVPAVRGGYAYAVVVDAGALLGPGLDGEEDALRHILAAVAHVRGRREGGAATVAGALPDPVTRCLATWSPANWAADAYAERAELGLPPARRVVEIEGSSSALGAALPLVTGAAAAAPESEVREASATGGSRVYLVSRRATQPIVDAVRALQVERSRAGHPDLRIHVDGPVEPAG